MQLLGKYVRNETAVRKMIAACMRRGILKEFMSKERKEIINIMGLLFSDEDIMRNFGLSQRREGRLEGERKGRREGRREGRLEGKLEERYAAVAEGEMSIGYAARKSGMTVGEFAEAMEEHGFAAPTEAVMA